MKLTQLKPMSTLDKAENLLYIMEEASKLSNNKEKTVKILKSEFTQSELRSIYKNALKQLSHDRYDKGDK